MSRTNAARRNRALRKIRKAQHVDPEIKLAIEVLLDLLSGQSGYNVAWPSAATIAKRLRRSRRSGQWYVRTIKALGIFKCTQLSPSDARRYCQQKYGFEPALDRCVIYAPILFEPNLEHTLWDSSKNLPVEVDREMGEIIRQIKAKRNAKTTSRLASNSAENPKQDCSQYCLKTIRDRIRKTRDVLRNDVANDIILAEAEEERWCRERLVDDVANDINIGVANDIQVFRLSSVEADGLVASPFGSLKAVATPSVTRSLKGLPSGSPARGSDREPNTPPTHHSARNSAEQSPSEGVIALTSEGRAAPTNLVGNGFAVRTKSGSTGPYRHGMSDPGVGRFDSELLETMERLEAEGDEKRRRLAANASNRPDAVEEEPSGWFLGR